MKVKNVEKKEGKTSLKQNIHPQKEEECFDGELILRNTSGYGMPDIDSDFANNDKLYKHLVDKWGENNVIAISNYNTLKMKSLVKDLAKYHDIPYQEVNKATKAAYNEAMSDAKKANDIEAGQYEPTFEECYEYSPTFKSFIDKYPQLKDQVGELMGQIRSISKHAGGKVITDDIHKNMPIITSKKTRQSPWSEGSTVRHLEPQGFIKFDILGLKTLSIIQDTIRRIIEEREDKEPEEVSFDEIREFYVNKLHPDVLDMDDQEVYENVYHDGKWIGVFQFTESKVQGFSERAKPRSIGDITAVTSIFRPGPLNASVDEKYLEAKANPEDIEYDHPLMEDVLKDTYGQLVYQEQMAKLAHKMGKNVSMEEGNLLRKILTKKGLSGSKLKKKKSIHSRFIEGCEEKGLSTSKAKEWWQKLENFSKYGFNKSHALSYAILSYQCAWLITHYQHEWVASYLDNELGSNDEDAASVKPEQKAEAINKARSFGYKIEMPDIHESRERWEISSREDKILHQPLTDVKQVGMKAYKQLEENRPFEKIEDLVFNEDIDYRSVNRNSIGNLIICGALEPLNDDRFESTKHFYHAITDEKLDDEQHLADQIEATKTKEQEYDRVDYIQNLVNIVGVYPFQLVISHRVREKIDENNVMSITEMMNSDQLISEQEIKDNNPGEYYKNLNFHKNICWFIITDYVEKTASNGNKYLILDVTDDSGADESIKCWGVNKWDVGHITKHKPYIGALKYQEKWGFSTKDIRERLIKVG